LESFLQGSGQHYAGFDFRVVCLPDPEHDLNRPRTACAVLCPDLSGRGPLP
jgi:hypothetical protein